MATIVTLTGLSGSGKSTMMRMMEKDGKAQNVLQWTSRNPRNDNELDEYVFCSRKKMLEKAMLGHFADLVEHAGNLYAISSYVNPRGKYVAIMNVAGLVQLRKWANENGHRLVSCLLNVDKSTSKERQMKRGDGRESIRMRALEEDVDGWHYDISVNAEGTKEETYDLLMEKLKKHGIH